MVNIVKKKEHFLNEEIILWLFSLTFQCKHIELNYYKDTIDNWTIKKHSKYSVFWPGVQRTLWLLNQTDAF